MRGRKSGVIQREIAQRNETFRHDDDDLHITFTYIFHVSYHSKQF